MIVVDCARQAIAELRRRAAKIWGVAEANVVFEGGHCRVAGTEAGQFEPLSIADITRRTGAVSAHAEMNGTGAGPGFGLHMVDVEVDRETSGARVLRYTVVEDAGKAIHLTNNPARNPDPRLARIDLKWT